MRSLRARLFVAILGIVLRRGRRLAGARHRADPRRRPRDNSGRRRPPGGHAERARRPGTGLQGRPAGRPEPAAPARVGAAARLRTAPILGGAAGRRGRSRGSRRAAPRVRRRRSTTRRKRERQRRNRRAGLRLRRPPAGEFGPRRHSPRRRLRRRLPALPRGAADRERVRGAAGACGGAAGAADDPAAAPAGAAAGELASGRDPEPLPLEGTEELDHSPSPSTRCPGSWRVARDAERAVLLSVSHDLRTPLDLDPRLHRGDRGRHDRPGARAPPSSGARRERLERLVGDLLALARLRQGVLEVRSEPVDLAAVAREAEERLRPRAAEAGVSVRVQGEPSLVTADHGRDPAGRHQPARERDPGQPRAGRR